MYVQDLLGRKVDVVEPEGLLWYIRDKGAVGGSCPLKYDSLCLIHILESIERVEEYTSER